MSQQDSVDPSIDPAVDEHLERMLREDAVREAYIEDAGFTLRVMAALPPPRAQRHYSWLGPALGAVAVAGLAWFTPLAGDLLAPLTVALKGHIVPLQGLLVLAPLMVLTCCTAWFAASDSN